MHSSEYIGHIHMMHNMIRVSLIPKVVYSGVFFPCKNYKSVQVRVKVSYLVSI